MESSCKPDRPAKRPAVEDKVDALPSRVVLVTAGSSIYDDAYSYRDYKANREEDGMFVDASISELGNG